MVIGVTGNAGFIGSHVADALIEQGHQVIGMDNFSGGFGRNVNMKTEHYRVELSEPGWVEEVFKKTKPEVVFHFAADAREGRSQFMPIGTTRDNLMASINVFTHAIKNGAKRIVYTSSIATYGDQEPPFVETDTLKPVDIYAANKQAGEISLKVLCDVHDVEYTILRPYNIYGPRQNISDPYRNVVGIFMNRIMQGKPPIIYGDGEQVRSFSYIGDILPAIVNAGFLNEAKNETYNIGPTKFYSVNELAQMVLKAMDSDLTPEHVAERPHDVKRAYCKTQKAEVFLGLKTDTTLDEGLKITADWAKDLGPVPFRYVEELELENEKTPSVWKNKEM